MDLGFDKIIGTYSIDELDSTKRASKQTGKNN